MKTLISFLSVTIFSLFFFSSCNRQNEVEKNYEISDALKIVTNYNVGKFSHEKATFKNGAVEIVTTENEIVFFIPENEEQYLMYVLQQNPSKAQLQLRESISNAQVLFFHRSLLINSLEKDLRLFFSIDDELPAHLSEIKVGKILSGFGLARYSRVQLTKNSIEDYHGIPTINGFFKTISKKSN